MTITTEEAELTRLAARFNESASHETFVTALRSLAAERDALRQERDAAQLGRDIVIENNLALRKDLEGERDALRAEVERLGAACDNYFRQVSLMQMKHARHLPTLEKRIARQRRALVKLYAKRHDRKAERDYLEKTALQAAQCHGRETLRADALQAEKVNLQDDLASVERERAHQHGRADRNAAEYAREQKKREQLQAENARLRKLVAYLAGTNTDHVQVALAGNPIVCDAIHAEARALLGETQ
jgi:hypothetical protein